MHYHIRPLAPDEHSLLPAFLLESIYIPAGAERPPASFVGTPEMQVYLRDFGREKDDWALAAEVDGQVAGIIWARIMDDYGHLDDATPSLAMSVLPGYRRQGIGSSLLRAMLELLRSNGYARTSLSVQKANTAACRLYEKAGFCPEVDHPDEWIMACRLQ